MFPSIAPLHKLWRARAGKSPARRSRPAPRRRTQLQVEALEERAVPTIAFLPHFGPETIAAGSTNEGMQHPTVNLIFSGSYWTTAQGQQDEANMISSVQSMLSGPYLSGLTQYGSDGTAVFGQAWNDSTAVAANPSTGTLQNFLQNSITNHNAAPGFNDTRHAPMFVVISDPTASANNGGGWNAPGTYFQSILWFRFAENIHMVWVGTDTDQWAGVSNDTKVWKDAFTSTLSHEIVETMSDPDGHGIHVTTPSTLPPSIKGDDQIGDNEPAADRYGYRLSGVWVQPYWSANDAAFIVPDGNSQTFFLDPIWNGSTFTGQFNLSVRGDQLGVDYGDNIRVDAWGANSSVTMNQQTAAFDPGQLHSINIDTRGGYNNVRIAEVAAGVSVNVDSSGLSNDFVVIGSDSGSLAGIQGSVNIANSSGHTWLEIYDSADSPRHITITDHSVAFNGLTTINYQAGFRWTSTGPVCGVTTLEVDDGLGPNQIEVDSVADLTNTMILGASSDVLFGPAANKVHLYRTH
jgi:hypothetical protein